MCVTDVLMSWGEKWRQANRGRLERSLVVELIGNTRLALIFILSQGVEMAL